MEQLLIDTENYVISLLKEKLSHTYIYHNVYHTIRVVKNVNTLIEKESLNDEEKIILQIAGWFHDTGFTKGHENHEENGAAIATEFLESKKVSQPIIDEVKRCILATKMNAEPASLLEKIIKDADCSHFAAKSYTETNELLREELDQLGIKSFSDMEWAKENARFMSSEHQYYTKYAQEKWQKGKERNLALLYKRIKKLEQQADRKKQKEEEFAFKKKKAAMPERGVETMFRVTLRNHITLSDIADTKANILLSVNAIIISLALSNLIPKLDNPSNEYLIVPTVIFIIFSVASMFLSVLATRPNVTSGQFSKEDVTNKKVNLLFFGNFHKMRLDDFEWAIQEVLKDKDYLYSSMTKDLYFLGKVLHRKYKILRLTYAIFMIGIIISVIAFGIAFKFYSMT
ncbi:Pycsar system effector family protein [Spongiivirga citrea]|uniref:HD domain-containing protein n=1 Tax=Spongiivirga citrea TaxID=1481457 RepID=A0A6M0CGA5_9FLAO|nr:Pycsar system effector family protein [Spongiivirga citrea]NER16936.1 HD domain-containing protein [Spongiivirga citrea]